MKKIKIICINLGSVIATLLMFMPFVIASQYNRFSSLIDFCFCIVISVLYDFYMYHILNTSNIIENEKEHYYKRVKDIDKKMHLDFSYKEKYKHLEDYIEDFFNRHTQN